MRVTGDPNFRYGVQVLDGLKAGEYTAKWGMDCELAKGDVKRVGGEGNYSPLDMPGNMRKAGNNSKTNALTRKAF